jgi:methionine biosynthesis protein MetW
MTKKQIEKRTVDMRVIGDWVETHSRVLDLGCGRGELLDYLKQAKQVSAVGVDLDLARITACVRRGVTAYQGDMTSFMRAFPERHFDKVICSRTVHELSNPSEVLLEALRVGRSVAVGFVNQGFWKNRTGALFNGSKVRNAIYTTEWHQSSPTNPVSIMDFERFCEANQIRITRRVQLMGDWKTPCRFLPNLTAGYAVYELER